MKKSTSSCAIEELTLTNSILFQQHLQTGTTLGAIIGGLLAGALSDLVGRKPVTLLSSVIFVVGAALMTFAHAYWLLLLGRVVVGVGVGKKDVAANGHDGDDYDYQDTLQVGSK